MSGASFDPLAPGAMDAAVLLATRVSALVLIAPVFSARNVAPSLRAALIVLITLLMLPLALGGGPYPALTAARVASEALIGFAMGLGAALIVAAAETAGELVATASGLNGASALDPLSQTESTSVGNFMRLFVLTLLLSVGGHLLSLDALAESARLVPVGTETAAAEGMRALAGQGSLLFALGLRFAAPVVAAVMVVNLALGVLNKAIPQIQAMAISFPIQIGIGLLALAGTLPAVALFLSGWPARYGTTVHHLLAAFAGLGGR